MGGEFVDLTISISDQVTPLLTKYGTLTQGSKQMNRVIGAIAVEVKEEYKNDLRKVFHTKTGKGLKSVKYKSVKNGRTTITPPFPFSIFEHPNVEVMVKSKKVLSNGLSIYGTSFTLPFHPVIKQSFSRYVSSGKVKTTTERILDKVAKEAGF